MEKKFGLALGCGGARGVAHVGFLKALEENKIKPDIITGCSMGSIVGAGYAYGMTISHIKNILFKLKKSDLFDMNVNPIKKNSLLAGKKMRALLAKHLGEINFDQLKIPFGCVATDVVTGRIVNLTEGNVVDSICASSAIPLALPAVKIGEHLLVDGGVLERNPVKLCKKMGAEVIVAVDVLGNLAHVSSYKNIFELALRIFDIQEATLTHKSHTRNADLVVYPDLGNISQYKIENQKFCYEKGYEAGINAIPKIKELLNI
ncbi:MAG: patatin-like phospholipase family protein [Clostridia bacterium]|nr:patatin-like phospholipase family protein [Clostridia bacterium]